MVPPALSPALGLWVAQLLSAAFFAVLFLQSGLDKVVDRQGNRAYIDGVFAKTPLRALSGLLLLAITLLEVASGSVSAAGVVGLALGHHGLAFSGAVLSGVSLLGLFFGQRVAKDYAGAAGLVPYFAVAIGAVLLQSAEA